MDREEAIQVIDIMLTADSGCPICTHQLLSRFIRAFPNFKQEAETAYKKEFGVKHSDYTYLDM